MSVMNLSIENMTMMSYLMFVISGVCAVAAVVLFFALDIEMCWRMGASRHLVSRKKQQKADQTATANKAMAQKIRQSEETFLLSNKAAAEFETDQNTVLLGCAEKAEVLGTVSLEKKSQKPLKYEKICDIVLKM